MNVLYLLVSLGKSLTFWQTMDDVVSIIVIVAAVALAAYQNYAKKEKKKNRSSRKKAVRPAPITMETEKPMSGKKGGYVSQCSENKKDKRVKGEGRKHWKTSVEVHDKVSSSTTRPPVPGKAVRLKTPEEARRAFIYSEIFNRKY